MQLNIFENFLCVNFGLHRVNKDSPPLSVFMFYFTSVIDMLLMKANRYYHQYLDRCDETPNPLQDIMNSKTILFLAIIVQMGQGIRDRLRENRYND